MNFLQKIAYQDFFSASYQFDPTQITFLANSNYKTSTFFVFKNHTAMPVGVLRISNTRQFVKKEYEILQHIYNYGPDSIKQSVPKPIRLHQCGSRYIASQSYVFNAKLKPPNWFERKRRKTVKIHLSKIRKWLQALWQTPVNHLSDSKVIRGVDIFEELDYCFARCNKDSESFFKKILSSAEYLRAQNVPLVINHNDLCLDNIFLDRKGIKVIDWELSYLTWPAYDWFYFVANYAHCLWAGKNMETTLVVKSVKRAFFECNWFSELVKDQTRKIYEDMNFDSALIPFFYRLGIFDFLYRRYFPKLISINRCTPLLFTDDLYLTR